MNRSATPAAIAVATAPATPRWVTVTPVLVGIITTLALVVGLVMTIGAWRASVDASIADLKLRMDRAEENQRTYIPVLIGLSKDVTYLADRARREDERRDREATRGRD